MKTKFLNKTIAIFLLINLIMLQFGSLTNYVVKAVYEELEEQNTKIQNTNVTFDVVYADDNTHSKKLNITEGGILSCYIKIDNTGVLNNAKIHIDSPNFKINQEKMDKTYIKNIDMEKNEIELNQIATNEIKISLPIEFEKKEYIDKGYFDKTNIIQFTGTYKTTTNNEKEIKSEIKVHTEWTDEVNVKIDKEFTKYLSLGDNGILLEQSIQSTTEENKLPKEKETIEVIVPEIESQLPKEISVLCNGNKIDYQYDENEHKVKIDNTKQTDNGINLCEDKDTYKIIYVYGTEIEFIKRQIEFNAKINTKYYGKEEKIENDILENIELEEKGKVMNIQYSSTNEIYKGYIQENSNNLTSIKENIEVEVSAKDFTLDTIKLGNCKWITKNGEESGVSNLYFSETKINKDQFLNLFGQDTSINVINAETGETIEIITKYTEPDENGNWVIKYPENVKQVELKTDGKANEIGTVSIINDKYIKGDSGYTKEQVQQIQILQNSIEVNSSIGNQKISNDIILKDTILDGKIEMNTSTLSTLSKNENVSIKATVFANDSKYSLCKDPTIQLVFPSEIETVDVHSINMLNTEEIVITKADIQKNQEGQYVITLETQGQMTDYIAKGIEGIEIIFDMDLQISYKVDTGNRDFKFIVNSNNENIEKTFTCMLKSPTDIVTVSSINDYNLETINNEGNKEAQIEAGNEEKEVVVQNSIINTEIDEMKNVIIQGNLLTNGSKNNMDISLNGNIEVNGIEEERITVYYTENEKATLDINETQNGWTQNVEEISNAKKYVVQIDSLSKGEEVDIQYNAQIPANISSNKTASQAYQVQYETVDSQVQTVNVDALKINSIPEAKIELNLSAEVGGEQVTEVKKGEIIHYKVTAQNTGSLDAEEVTIKGKIPEGTVYIEQTASMFSGENVSDGEEWATDDYFMKKYADKKEVEFKTSIKKGESIVKEYEVLVLDDVTENTKISNIINANYLDIEETSNEITHNVKNSEIKVRLATVSGENGNLNIGYSYSYNVLVENTTNKEKKNVPLEIIVDDKYVEVDSIYHEDERVEDQTEFMIDKIPAYSSYTVCVRLSVKMFKTTEPQEMTFSALAKDNLNTYHSNQKKLTLYPANLEVSITSDKAGEEVEAGDFIIYNMQVQNKSNYDIDGILIENIVSDNVTLNSVTLNGEILEEDEDYTLESDVENEKQIISLDKGIKANETLDLKINVIVNYIPNLSEDIKLLSTFDIAVNSYIVETAQTYHIMKAVTNSNSSGDNNNSNNGNNNDNSNTDDEPIIEGTQLISGIAWIDKNENGKRDTSENILKGITVKLLNPDTNEVVKNANGKEIIATTQNDGIYILKNVPQGKYIVIFEFDTYNYSVTKYKMTGVEENLNSKVIMKNITINGKEQTVGCTELLDVQNEDINNINIGLKPVNKFDLKIEKYVSSVTVKQNDTSDTRYFNNSKLAKVEIEAKKANNTEVSIEYVIKVSNIGDIEGYVKDIVDYLPTDCTFNQAQNEGWTNDNSNLHNKILQNTKILPGESKEIKLILNKKMTKNNVGIIVNNVEISKYYNEKDLKDNNSNDNNSTAEFMVGIKTGGGIIISGIITAIVIGIIIVVVIIKRRRKYV